MKAVAGVPDFEAVLGHIDLDRGSRSVLRDIHWRIRSNEHWVLWGGNGAGKTQLLKLLAGAVWPKPTKKGVRKYRMGREWHHTTQDIRAEIAYVGPERQDQFERYGWNARVLDVVAAGHFRTDILLDPIDAKARRAVIAALARFELEAFAERRFLTLSYGERRLVLIARAVASRPELMLLDELFTGLDPRHRALVMRWLEASARSRRPWVLAAHRPEDIPAGATHALQLERGRIVRQGRLTRTALAKWFGPRPRKAQGARRASPRAARSAGRVLVKLSNANVHVDGHPLLRGIEMTVRAGECWIVHGGNGAGKTTLLQTLYGDHGVAAGGSVERDGVEPGVALETFRVRVGLVAPHLQTLYPRHLSVIDTVVSGAHASIGLAEKASARELARARAALSRFAIARHAKRTLGELSYGQVRRVMFARAAMSSPDLMLLDEPYSGLDPVTRADLQSRMDRLVRSGTAVVLATHHAEEWPRSATHELELRRGAARYAGVIR